MNKLIRKVKLISRNILAAVVYYSSFNPLYKKEPQPQKLKIL